MASIGYSCTLSPELVQKAQKELKEKPEWRERDIQALRDMLKIHKGLSCPMDDGFLLRFLRAKKFDYDRAYQLVINYYTIRAENRDILKELTPAALRHVLLGGVTMILPRREKHGRCILYFRPSKWDPDMYSIYDILRTNILNLEMAVRSEETQVNGIVAIGNMENMTWNHAKNVERNYVKIMTGLIQDAFPMRFKGLHVINEPSFISYVFAIIKPFLKEKMASRLNFHGSNISALHEELGKECLPKELDGDLPSGDELAKEWKQKLDGEASMFDEMAKHKIHLTHEITTMKKADDGMDCLTGTYKKLNVD